MSGYSRRQAPFAQCMSEAKEEEAVPEEAAAAKPGLNAKSLLNNAIQTALSKNRVEGSKIPAIASMVVAF